VLQAAVTFFCPSEGNLRCHFSSWIIEHARITTIAMKVPLIVTLVHGTWGSGAPFTRPGSPLRRAITDLLEPRLPLSNREFLRVGFLTFNWKGANGNHSRLTASAELQKFLWEATAKYPNYRHIVIAHSHGGNVVLHALKEDGRLSSRIAGIITVGTPFLIAQELSFGAQIMHHLIAGAFRTPMRSLTLIAVVSLLTVMALAQRSPYSGLSHALDSPSIFLPGLLAIVGGIWLLLLLFKKQFEASEQWFKRLQLTPLPCKGLCLFAQYDEPGALLSALSALRTVLEAGEFLLAALLLLIAFLSGFILFPFMAVSWLIGYLSDFHILRAALAGLQDWLMDHDQPFLFAGAALCTAITALVLLPVLRTMLDLLAFGTFGFGIAEWRHGWFFKQTACLKPPPSALAGDVVEFRSTELVQELGWFRVLTGLRHSILFRSRRSLERIQQFVASCE
jgi:hypothetical protein